MIEVFLQKLSKFQDYFSKDSSILEQFYLKNKLQLKTFSSKRLNQLLYQYGKIEGHVHMNALNFSQEKLSRLCQYSDQQREDLLLEWSVNWLLVL